MPQSEKSPLVSLPRETVEALVGTLATSASLLRASEASRAVLNLEPTAGRCARFSAELYGALQERSHV